MSSIELDNNNDELEEGEIAEDSNDACSLDDDDIDDLNSADLGSANRGLGAGGSLVNAGSAAAAEDDGGPQKKRKKVVRKVRRKIKVKKKVVRKKGNGNNGGGGINNNDNSSNNNNSVDSNNAARGPVSITTATNINRNDNSSILNVNNQMSVTNFSNPNLNHSTQLQPQPQQHHLQLHQQPLLPITTTNSPMIMNPAPLLPHLQPTQQHQSLDMNLIQQQQLLLNQHHNSPQQHLLQQHQNQHLPMHPQQHQPQLLHQQQPQPQNMIPNPQPSLDSLWEQQILMLQELQRHQAEQQTQILRAAATDEDLRIFGPPLPTVTLPQTTASNNININNLSNNLTYQHQQPLQQTPNITTTNTTTTTTTPMLPNNYNQPLNTITSKEANVMHGGTITTNIKQNHQTPSSPDDENGKSSYEAISKMLTLLRNSANVSDSPSEMNDGDTTTTIRDNNNEQSHMILDSKLKQQQQNRGTIEYSLIPILVDGIDYTKYKLLSQFEPKFKNDPRLNQQT